MKTIIIACLLFVLAPLPVSKNNTGIFEGNADVGNPKIKGSTVYDKKTKTYTLTGSGYNIWFNRDEFQFAWKKVKGDFTATAHFEFEGEGKEAHRKIGWMIRESLADTAVHISAVAHGDGLTVMQWRVKPGMNMRDPEDEIRAPEQKKYAVLQLQRKGNNFIMRIAEKEGDPFIVVGEHEMANLADEIFAGIFICSHNPDVTETAKVRDVHIKQ
jgi:hypothetical protein